MTSTKPFIASISISDCQKIFELNRYTPEQIVDQVFIQQRTKPLGRDEFVQNLLRSFSNNVAPENSSKVNEASIRIYDVCSQGASQITVEQLGKGIGVFTARREPMGLLRDLFFYLDKEGKNVIQESHIQNFISEAAEKGIKLSIGNELADLKRKITSERGTFELSYWTFYISRNHPAIKYLLAMFKDFQDKKQGGASHFSQGGHEGGFVERTNEFSVRDSGLEVSKPSEEREKTAGAGLHAHGEVDQKPKEPAVTFGGSTGILARETEKLKSFDEFLELGSKLGFNHISAKEFLRQRKEFFFNHKKFYGDIMLHEFIRIAVDMFKHPDDDYYEFTNNVIKLFQFMDINNNGLLEIHEALQGIIHLFGGTEEDKIIAAFMLFDTDESGFIEYNEVFSFIHSTIKLKEHQGENYSEQDLAKLKQIASATAHDVFEAMDSDHSGKVTVEEFMAWFKATKGEVKPVEIQAAKMIKEHKLKSYVKKVQKLKEAQKLMAKNLKHDFIKNEFSDCKADTFIIEEIRKKIPFQNVHVQTAAETLKSQHPSRVVNYTDFQKFIALLVKQHSLPGAENVAEVSRKLFNALDSNKNGLLEISEISTGLSLLCGGNQIEKIHAGFDLFDENEDHVLSFPETVNFMGSFFKIIQTDNPKLDVYNQDPYKYAYAMAFKIFQECGVPLEGGLEFYSLKKWVQSLHQ